MDTATFERALVKVPHYMREGVREYVAVGRPPGDFLRAVLENNLHHAALRADKDNQQCLFGWAAVLDVLPMGIWGSKEKVVEYLACCHAQRE